MNQHRSTSVAKRTCGAVLAAITSALTITALGTAGSANATCVSVNGIHNGGGCESSAGSAAVALGRNATAKAVGGPGNLAVAVGNPGFNNVYSPLADGDVSTQALAQGTFNRSFAIGDGTNAGSSGLGNAAIAVGNGNNAFSFGGYHDYAPPPLSSDFNTSIVVGKNSNANAVGPARRLATAFGNGKTGLNNALKPATPNN
jgi:hypothetical protein